MILLIIALVTGLSAIALKKAQDKALSISTSYEPMVTNEIKKLGA
jgi:hypothetical protein